MTADERVAAGTEALRAGDWVVARAEFEAALAVVDSGPARFGLGSVLWWLGETGESVKQCTHAYRLFRVSGAVENAVQCAVWLGITHKANFGDDAVANGWIARADRLLQPLPPGSLHGWAWIARGYRLQDLDEAERLTQEAYDLARDLGDVDLEMVSLAQLGLTRIGKGEAEPGLAMVDEAMAATLAGETTSLDTTVYVCCDMLRACELLGDVERAAQWCRVAQEFVAAYGCPFLYAECRILYGSVLCSHGRWAEGERELLSGLRSSDGASPRLHASGTVRLAGLRIRQGRLEEADELLARADAVGHAEGEHAVWAAALLLARGDVGGASRRLDRSPDAPNEHLGAGLEIRADALLAAGDSAGARETVDQLETLARGGADPRLVAAAAGARGRLAGQLGDTERATASLELARAEWARLDLPYEAARARFDLARVLIVTARDAAIAHARGALAVLESLGAALDADRVAAFLRGHGVRARTRPRGVGSLTPRENEVLGLLGVGLTNPEIAQRLHVTRKTAAHHVSHILAKLQLRNRAEAAAYVSRHA